jgi:hypothetical protein
MLDGTGVGTGNTTLDGTDVGKAVTGIITAVVDGIVTTETVDGTTDPGTITGELGKIDTGGSDKVATTVVGIGVGTGTTTLDEIQVGTAVTGIITIVVDGIVITVTVDGTTDPGMNTGELGKTDTDGTGKLTTVLTETTETVGTTELEATEIGNSLKGTELGIMVVWVGAITIVLLVCKV